MHKVILWRIGNYTVHGQEIIMDAVTILIILLFIFIGKRKWTSGKPGMHQNILEWILDFVNGIASDNINNRKIAASLKFYLYSLIIYIFFSNQIGLIPDLFEPALRHVSFLRINEMFDDSQLTSPTADINTCVGLALITLCIYVFLGIKVRKGRYFHDFITPMPFFMPIHLIDFFAKPLTLTFRLFGNIFAGEVMISVILMLPGYAKFGAIIPLPIWLAFSIFIGTIQAYVFTILTCAYTGQAITEQEV